MAAFSPTQTRCQKALDAHDMKIPTSDPVVRRLLLQPFVCCGLSDAAAEGEEIWKFIASALTEENKAAADITLFDG